MRTTTTKGVADTCSASRRPGLGDSARPHHAMPGEGALAGEKPIMKGKVGIGGYEISSNDKEQHILRRVANTIVQTKNTIQRALPQVNRLLVRYADLIGQDDNIHRGPYNSWAELQQVMEGAAFTPAQKRKLTAAMHGFDDQGNRIRVLDRSWNVVEGAERTPNEVFERIRQIEEAFPPDSHHHNILNAISHEIEQRIGVDAIPQFWRGAHIVFNDGGVVYNQLIALGGPIAARRATGEIKTKTEFVGRTAANYFGLADNTAEQRAGSMKIRRPGRFQETSHYPETEGGPPQYGVDMPEAIGGHILFGLTPQGDTFVQTEGAGFQNFYQGTIRHLMGYFTVKGYGAPVGTQTGMAGYSRHSEATRTEIREHESVNFNDFLASIQ